LLKLLLLQSQSLHLVLPALFLLLFLTTLAADFFHLELVSIIQHSGVYSALGFLALLPLLLFFDSLTMLLHSRKLVCLAARFFHL
jgi:hypothetical protein